MKKKVLFLLVISLLSCISLFGQSAFDVSGTVVDKATGEAVIGGSIKLMALPDSSFVEGTTTGTQGEFSLKDVKKGTYALQISYIVHYYFKLVTSVYASILGGSL